MNRRSQLVGALVLMCATFVSSCKGKDLATEPGVTLGPAPETWSVESGTRLSLAVSSSTINGITGGFRTYIPLAETATSVDGLTWTGRALFQLPETPTYNSSVLRLPDGTYLMLYEYGRTSLQDPKGARFYRATSTNTTTWTKTAGSSTNGSVFEPGSSDDNFIGVPDMIVLSDGSIRMYYVAGGEHMESARSTNAGLSWTREGRLTISGLPTSRLGVDPDVVQLADGRFRLYFTAPPSGSSLDNKSILSATSSDGLSFLLDSGERVKATDGSMDFVDPDVIRLSDGRYRMYFGYRASSSQQYELRSAITQ